MLVPKGESFDPGEPTDDRATWGLSSYYGNCGSKGVGGGGVTERPRDGIFYTNSAVNLATDVPDGLSSTLLFGERHNYDPNLRQVSGINIHNYALWGWPYYSMQTLSGFSPINYQYPSSVPPGAGVSRETSTPLTGETSTGDVETGSYAELVKRLNAYGSGHPGGANFVYCDSSIHFLASETPLDILRALSTAAGNETVSGY